MRIDWVDWINDRHGLWGLLSVVVAVLTLVASMYFFVDRKSDSPNEKAETVPTTPLPNLSNWVDWINDRHGLWGLLSVVVAVLTLVASMYFFVDRKSDSPNEKAETVPTAPLPNLSTGTRTFPIIEGEVFQACGMSGLFLTALHSGPGIASIGKKQGAFFDEAGDILRDPILLLNEPAKLSASCTLSIIDTYSVQGHSSFSVLIERKDK